MNTASLPGRVRLVEVGPRDGLQNESTPVPVSTRVALIEALADAGLNTIECGSFVSPKRVPQMAGTDQVFRALRRIPGVSYTALVPNSQGLEAAARCRPDAVAVFISSSESFSQANINCSIAESLERSRKVVAAARILSIPVRGYLSCVLGCPFEGAVAPAKVAHFAEALFDLGCYEISLGDTIGTGTPLSTQQMLAAVLRHVPLESVAVHFHDTFGQALANTLTSLQAGVATIDTSVSGLGGCPYAPGATGNVATEDVLYMLHGMGIRTGVDLTKVVQAGTAICAALGRRSASKAAVALQASSTSSS